MPTTPDADEWIGRALGGDARYLVTRRLGEGGMGAVFVAHDSVAGVDVALKVLHPRLAGEPRHLARFRREAEVGAQLAHPHLVRTIDTGQEPDGTPWLVMELVAGEPLSAMMRRERVLAVPRAVALVRQIAAGASAAHEVGIVHRDLKPGNVMISEREGREHAAVLDLGLARFFDSETFQKLTVTGQVVGTPTYMAPEQAFGDAVDHRADIYACGAVLCALITGAPPYGRGRIETVLPRLLAGEREPLTHSHPDLGPITDVVERCLELEPEARYESAAELDAALLELDDTPNASITPWERPATIQTLRLLPDPILDAPRPRRRPRTISPREQPAPPKAAAPSPQKRAVPWATVALGLLGAAIGATTVAWVVTGGEGDVAVGSSSESADVPASGAIAPTLLVSDASTLDAPDAGSTDDGETLPGVAVAQGAPATEANPALSASPSSTSSPLPPVPVPTALWVDVTLLETFATLAQVQRRHEGSVESFVRCLLVHAEDVGRDLPETFELGMVGERPDVYNVDVTARSGTRFFYCAQTHLRVGGMPPRPNGHWQIRFRYRVSASNDDNVVRFADESSWRTRPAVPPRLRFQITITSSSLPFDVMRRHLTARRDAFAACLVRLGDLGVPPPYRGTLEWGRMREFGYYDGEPTGHQPGPLRICMDRDIGRQVPLPFARGGEKATATYLAEAADSTRIVVIDGR